MEESTVVGRFGVEDDDDDVFVSCCCCWASGLGCCCCGCFTAPVLIGVAVVGAETSSSSELDCAAVSTMGLVVGFAVTCACLACGCCGVDLGLS